MKTQPQILFITSSINYPFFRKRIIALHRLVNNSLVIGFKRRLNYPTADYPFDILPLGTIKPGHYFYRLRTIFLGAIEVRKKIDEYNIIYFFGLDMAILTLISILLNRKRKVLAYEVQDIREVLTRSGIYSVILRFIEKHIMKKIDILIVTSGAYISKYYKEILNIKNLNYIVLENKLLYEELPVKPVNINLSKSIHRPLTIGYFGSIRCQVAWSAIVDLCSTNSDHIHLHIRGVPQNIDSFYSDIQKNPNLFYGGAYKDPDDLKEVYSNVDLVWIAGFHGKDSYGWSRSCRFYNACCFKIPIIAQENTVEGEIVRKLDIGLTVDINVRSSIQKLLNISIKTIQYWRNSMNRLPENIFTYSNEHDLLLLKLKALISDE